MSESDTGIHFPNTTDAATVTESKTSGRVKWFNNKSGYGFVTITGGVHEGTDIFVHHSSITVDKEQYRYLVQGEYVDFILKEMLDSEHKWQATEVSGISGGKLMCETRLETRATRNDATGPTTTQKTIRSSYRVRPQGQGPREGDEWMLVRRKTQTGKSEQSTARSRHSRSTKD